VDSVETFSSCDCNDYSFFNKSSSFTYSLVSIYAWLDDRTSSEISKMTYRDMLELMQVRSEYRKENERLLRESGVVAPIEDKKDAIDIIE
jgi:short subunit dehydrogenase-like uncharacterized protein